ncbi:cyanophycin synthetase [Fluviibacter phosphoraccumulans]|uniref:Cyanophycin synthetase n=1 Tax=Fluviibacter phosphoraccumulans TaxID=1751046 RepID=A0A7R6QYV5_9RHOO|nr:cyanophycin synthetase [Fluviibacter phosphoraccumulans]BBU70002.1 cyanophycin synthetase [Fluviibacter phosphoraccumulans]BBU70806.1 cyanophycin synthetase [Fluviibacter phosphoraccumulans]
MSHKTIKIIDIKSIRGPNMWTYVPVLEAWVDIGDLEDFPSNKIPGLPERLVAWLPSLMEHRCSYEEYGGFVKRLHEGTWPAHIMEHVTLELLSLAGVPGGFGRARDGGRRSVYKVIIHNLHDEVTRLALTMGRDLIMAAIEDQPFDVAAAVEELKDLAEDRLLGPSTGSIVNAAMERKIPTMRLAENNLVQLGYGSKQRRIWTAETDQTSAIAETISRDKDLTKSLLKACGVPVPEGVVVETADDAWEAAEDIGLPVVVKPSDGNHGRGVFTNLMTEAEVRTAFSVAVDEGSSVIVERFIPGNEHRLLVVGGKMVAAARGDFAFVKGDGQSTIEQLIETQINSSPSRGPAEENTLNFVRVDSAVRLELERQGLNAQSVPAAGHDVLIQRNGNVSIDVTDEVHPDVAHVVALAARVVGLDVAGIDLVAEDISKPLAGQRGAIVEVNAGPGLLMHLRPSAGTPRPVGSAIVDYLFPPGEDFNLPIIGVAGSRGKTLVAQLIASLLQLTSMNVGLACSKGMYFNQRQLDDRHCADWESGHRLMLNRQVDVAIIENDNRGILNDGLPYERCTIGVVTNLDPTDTVPECAINDAEGIYKVMRSQIDVVLPSGTGVLNADDAEVADMARLCDGEVIFFSRFGNAACLTEHLDKGGRAVFSRDGQIMAARGSDVQPLMAINSIPLLQLRNDALESILAAVAVGVAMNLPREIMSTGIQTFSHQ